MADDVSLVSIASAGLSAQIDPLGAQLSVLRDADGRDLLWNGDAAFWTGRAPILFPIVGELRRGAYRVEGETYHLPRHGFARRSLFAVAEHGPSFARFRLVWNAQTLASYPFRFQLAVIFDLSASRLSLSAIITNRDARPLPASFGFHPALRWPLPYGAERNAHRIHFEQDETAPVRRLDAEGLIRPERFPSPVIGRDLALDDQLFVDDAVIFDAINSQALNYGARGGPQLRIEFPGSPYLGVWTKPGAPFLCIEPWWGLADPEGFDGDFRHKPGVFEVAPGDERHIEMSITLSA